VKPWVARGPRSMEDLLSNWIPRKFGVGVQLGLACFAALAWAVWITRNNICIQHVFPNNSLHTVYLALSFIQKWCVLMRSSEGATVEAVMKKIQVFAAGFRPSSNSSSDIRFM
jgi:type III secretory pathway component EscR